MATPTTVRHGKVLVVLAAGAIASPMPVVTAVTDGIGTGKVAWAVGGAVALANVSAQPVAGYPSTAHSRPLSRRSEFTAASTCALVAVVGATTQCTAGVGGVEPDGASAGNPKSTTTATRFFPDCAGVVAQIVVNSGAMRGGRDVVASAPATSKRHPSTVPSAGTIASGAFWANSQVGPVEFQNVQYR